ERVARADVLRELLLEGLGLGPHAQPTRAIDVGHDRDVLLGHDHVGERDGPPRHGPTVLCARCRPSQARPSSSPARAGSSAATSSNGSYATAPACGPCAATTRATTAARSTGWRPMSWPRWRSCPASCATSSPWQPPSRAP